MKFKYNNKIYETPNLEKKLKRMKLTLDDVQIVQDDFKEVENNNWEFEGMKEWIYFKHPKNEQIHCCLVDIGTIPDKHQLFKDGIFDVEYINELEIIDFNLKLI